MPLQAELFLRDGGGRNGEDGGQLGIAKPQTDEKAQAQLLLRQLGVARQQAAGETIPGIVA